MHARKGEKRIRHVRVPTYRAPSVKINNFYPFPGWSRNIIEACGVVSTSEKFRTVLRVH